MSGLTGPNSPFTRYEQMERLDTNGTTAKKPPPWYLSRIHTNRLDEGGADKAPAHRRQEPTILSQSLALDQGFSFLENNADVIAKDTFLAPDSSPAYGTQPWSDVRATTPLDGSCINPDIEAAVQDVLANGVRDASITDQPPRAGRRQDPTNADADQTPGPTDMPDAPDSSGAAVPSAAVQESTQNLIKFGQAKLDGSGDSITEDFVHERFIDDASAPSGPSRSSGGKPFKASPFKASPGRMKPAIAKCAQKHALISLRKKQEPVNTFRKLKPGEKCAYGAWYLPVRQWKARPASEQLIGPKAELEKALEAEAAAAKKAEVAMQLKNSTGLRMFLEFIKEKNERPPKFLQS